MHILKEVGKYESFLTNRSKDDEKEVWALFDSVAKSVMDMKEEKLSLPHGFIRDLGLYLDGSKEITEYFLDVEKRYLLLSDLYGFFKLTGRFKNV